MDTAEKQIAEHKHHLLVTSYETEDKSSNNGNEDVLVRELEQASMHQSLGLAICHCKLLVLVALIFIIMRTTP